MATFAEAFNEETVGQRWRLPTMPPDMSWCIPAFGDGVICEIELGVSTPARVGLDELSRTDWERREIPARNP